MNEKIDSNLQMGVVTLTVADLARSLDYYRRHIGLEQLGGDQQESVLGNGGRALLRLRHLPGARLDRRATGLYHFALRVPSRTALAQVVRHFSEAQTAVGGASDHHVSEALYLSDPDGHGIEIYRDRPRAQWLDREGNFKMGTDPLNFPELMRHDDGAQWQGLPAGSDMGHVHLQVDDTAKAEQFYTEVLGFETMAHYPGAAFVSAGGYHHHLGLNSWHSRNGKPPAADAARLLSYEIVLSDERELAKVAGRAQAAAVDVERQADGIFIIDPAGIQIIFKAV